MNDQQPEDQGDAQQQFLEAFKELLDLQNQRLGSTNDQYSQFCPHLLFPIISPTQIPNTFVVNLGPFYTHIQNPQVMAYGQQQQSQQPIIKQEEEDPRQK